MKGQAGQSAQGPSDDELLTAPTHLCSEGRAMDSVNLNGAELAYEFKVSGEPVILISTGPIADSFLPLFAEKVLVEPFRLIRYRQRRIAAASTQSPAPVSFAEHAA